MTRITGPDCVVMCNLINTYIHTYIHTYIQTYINTQNSCRRRAGNGGDMADKRKKCRKERAGSVAAIPDA